ncbi:hypothetical protein ACIQMZ_32470 [Streptomyces longwoodensis]|uniref:hypothetical protein n=1 Tax=Streptomyces longwoodensis TaxID=68231 RepID=UPI00380C6B86
MHSPWWHELWRRHAHITTPLRARGLPCDIEFGLSAYVRVSLPDDSYLVISPPHDPPSERQPRDPEGWIATREHPDDHMTVTDETAGELGMPWGYILHPQGIEVISMAHTGAGPHVARDTDPSTPFSDHPANWPAITTRRRPTTSRATRPPRPAAGPASTGPRTAARR